MRSRALVGAVSGLSVVTGAAVVSIVLQGGHNNNRGVYAALALAIGWGFTATGLYVARRRPESNIGPLMIGVGFAGFLKSLAFSNNSVVYAIGSLGETVIYALLVHLLLSFPSGRLQSRLDRALVVLAYVNTVVVQLAAFVFEDPVREGCATCPSNPLLIEPSRASTVLSTAQVDIAVALLGAVVAVLYRRWRVSTPNQARAFTPVLAVGSLTFLILMTELIVEQANVSSELAEALTIALFASIACLPGALVLGLLRYRFRQGEAIGVLVGRLSEGIPRGGLRDALAEALGDNTLELAYWVPEQRSYVDSDGKPVKVEPPAAGRHVTTIENEGRLIAAIIHAADLAQEPGLVQAVGAAAALTLQNERLAAELRAKVAELHASRSRILQAGYEQRRRIERDLHDGAQQRLMALGIDLRLVREHIDGDPAQAAELLDEALRELGEATRELRELARGIHPAVLTDRGLKAALKGLAGRSPVPVEVLETPVDRLPSPIEAAVYFIVAEALTNAARYAGASRVTVSIARENGEVEVDVSDDGVGGADPDHGSGLRGLHDRVSALDGSLLLASASGAGTSLTARIPCG